MTDERMSGALQENVLTLLCFDDHHCKLIRAAVTPHIFESAVFREVAGHAIDFIDRYGVAIKDHLPDHIEHILRSDDKRKADTYARLLDNLLQSKETVNAEYVMSSLHKFVRGQNWKSAIVQATEAAQDNRMDEVELIMSKALKNQVVSFSGGLSLSKPEDVLSIMDMPEEEGFDLGIPELDRRGIIPRRKEQLMFIAPRGRGKSWFITHCAKQALLQRWSVVIISLEMSEKRYAARMLQSFYSISRRESEVLVPRFVLDKQGGLLDIAPERIHRITMQDSNIKEILTNKVKRDFRRRPPFRIKEFPTKQLSMQGLEAYLDNLERYENMTPDLILIDYPDLMKLNVNNLRLELGDVLAEIRGLGVRRNAATVVVSQGNREAETASLVTGAHAAEDISKIATPDTVFTYSQTTMEKKLSLARLFVEKARNEDSKMQILLSQAYGIGQFALDSVLLDAGYWDMLDDKDPDVKRRRRREETE